MRREYYIKNRDKLSAACRQYYQRNRLKILEQERQRRLKNPDKDRTQHLRQNYGMTQAEFDSLVLQQDGLCKICKSKPKRLYVDHCHQSKRVRGLLCIHCNFLLGHAKDKQEILGKAIIYLNEALT